MKSVFILSSLHRTTRNVSCGSLRAGRKERALLTEADSCRLKVCMKYSTCPTIKYPISTNSNQFSHSRTASSLFVQSHVRHFSALPDKAEVTSKKSYGLIQAKYGDASKVLANLSEEEAKRLKVLKLEYDVFYSTGIKVPDQVSDEQWVKLLFECKSFSSRKNYYTYLFKREKSILNEKAKHARNIAIQEEKHRARLEKAKAEGEQAFSFKNAFLMHIQEATMNRLWYNNIYYAMMNGPHLVFDFSFEKQMTERELRSLNTQLQICHGLNKVHREPFHFHFCNVPSGSTTEQILTAGFGNLASMPISVTSQHYLELYPKKRLVYLSPNAPATMDDHFDTDDVYIIGALVDKAKEDPLTFARAKKENLRMVRFPLDKYVRWVQGSKSLTINHVVNILLEYKSTADWKKSLVDSLPTRKYSKDW